MKTLRIIKTATRTYKETEIVATRFPELGYQGQGAGNWRIIDKSSDAAVGPSYRSRAELLADLNRFAEAFGCDV